MSTQKFTTRIDEPEDRESATLRFLVFGYNAYEPAGGIGDFLSDTDNDQAALALIQDAVARGNACDMYDIFDTQTKRNIRIDVTSEPDATFRVVLKGIPEEKEKRLAVELFVKTTLKLSLLEVRPFMESLPSFIGSNLPEKTAIALQEELTKFGAVAVVEKE